MTRQGATGSSAVGVGKRFLTLSRVLGLTVLVLLAGSRAASATHFAGGRLSWVQDLNYQGPGSVKVTVTFEGAFRWSFESWPYPTPLNPPVGTIIDQVVLLQVTGNNYSQYFDVPLLVTSVSPAEDRLTGNGSIDLILPGSSFPVTVSFASCCRVSTLAEDNHDTNIFLTTVIDLSKATRSPVSTALPRITLPQNVPAAFQLPSLAFDGLTNIFSFVPSSTSGLTTPRPNGTSYCSAGCPGDWPDNSGPYSQSMQLSNAGVITWTPQLTGLYSAQFSITSYDNNFGARTSIPLDIEFEVVPAVPCAPGSFSATGATPCTPAPAGSYVSTTGATSATPCPVGSFSSAQGATSCTLAPAGSFVGTTGATSATLCLAGSFSSASGATSCTLAPAGSYVGTTGATSATLCLAGTFSSASGATSCTLAPAGSFVGTTGATSATPCLAGSFSSAQGATSCTLAPAGSYVSTTGATSATPCPAGSFSSTSGATSCTLAPAGSYVSTTGATSATPCPAGSFSSTSGATSCTPAPAGYFDSGTGNTSATPCPAGTWSSSGASACTSAALLLSQAIDAYLGAGTGPGNSLHQKAQNISGAPNADAKAGMLQAFINEVNALRGNLLTDAQADYLILLARLL